MKLPMTHAKLPVIVAVLACAVVAVAQEKPAVLTIHLEKAVSKVSPMLYGLMTEEINYSYDGGLYAEMIRNRTFRARRRDVPYWFLAEYGNAQAAMEIDPQTGPSEALNYSLKLTVSHADRQNPAGVLNTGYWGIPLKPNTTYNGSFYAKADSDAIGPMTMKVLADADDAVLAETHVSGLTSQWKQYQFSFKTGSIHRVFKQSFCSDSGTPGHALAQSAFVVSSHLPRSQQRQSRRHHGKAGGNASGVPAFPRRQLSRGRAHS